MRTVVVTAIATAFTSLILIGVMFGMTGKTTEYTKDELIQVQTTRVVNAVMALDSVPEGSLDLNLDGYALRCTNNELAIRYGESVRKEDVKFLGNAYDVVEVPSEFKEINGDLTLVKKQEDGREILTFRFEEDG